MNKRAKKDISCGSCGKKLEGKPFVDQRYTNGKCKDGIYRWGHFCLTCEPYADMGEHH